jgi:DNA primase
LGKNLSATNYLLKRQVNKKIISEFQLGFVPNNSDYYNDLLKKFTEEEIKQTGLFYKNEKNNKFINRFHSRIIFPIKNIVGDVVAFGGRIIKESQIAKYINSPETEFYKKGKHIFNLEKVKSRSNSS